MASLDNPRMLVVDDDIDFARMLRTLLEDEFSARVTTVGDCASARLALSGSTFDVVTMDYELPDGNGVDVMEELVAVTNHPPVVMVTGKGDEPTAARACLLGAAGYVVKDKKLNSMLVSAVRSALEHVHSAKLLHEVKVYGGAITAYNNGGACFEFRILDYMA